MCNISERRRKRGEEGLDGRIFWSYISAGEMWLSPEKFKDTYDKKVISRKKWSLNNTENIRLAGIAYLEANREAISKRRKARFKVTYNPGSKVRSRKYYHSHKEQHRASAKKYLANLSLEKRAKFRARSNKRAAERTRTDPLYALTRRLRNRIKRVLRLALGGKLIPASRDRHRLSVEFLIWLAAKQRLGKAYMSTHTVDHIIPMLWLARNHPDEQWRINAPENVRWLTPKENYSKGYNMPSQDEIDAHLKLVAEWQATLGITIQGDKNVVCIQKVE